MKVARQFVAWNVAKKTNGSGGYGLRRAIRRVDGKGRKTFPLAHHTVPYRKMVHSRRCNQKPPPIPSRTRTTTITRTKPGALATIYGTQLLISTGGRGPKKSLALY
jgi:hypothetical protein